MSVSIHAAWERLSKGYHHAVRISTNDVHFGPVGPAESQLQLLGEVRGRRVLELGCGGGHNSVALARRGAHVTGVDFAESQLQHARTLSRSHGVSVQYVLRDLGGPEPLPAGTWDLVITSFVTEYIEDLPTLFGAVSSALVDGGQFVICDLHPLVSSVDLVGANLAKVIRSIDYFKRRVVPFEWPLPDGSSVGLYRFHRPISEYVNLLIDIGLKIKRIVEPEIWLDDRRDANFAYFDSTIIDQCEVWRRLPYTLIISATKVV